MYKAIILPQAREDIKNAALWYNDQQPRLGKRFTAAVRKKVRFICQNPKIVAVRYKSSRTALLETFPYLIHFTIDENNKHIVISAVLSTHRDPGLWPDQQEHFDE